MSSKLPIPTYRREMKSLSPQSKDKDHSFNSSNNSSNAEDFKRPKDKYSHVKSKVQTHWSFEEKQRTGIRDFFDRKLGTSSANSSVTTSPEIVKSTSNRRSLPMPMPKDPIAIAIAQIKRNTRFYSFSDNTSSSSSMSSVAEVHYEEH